MPRVKRKFSKKFLGALAVVVIAGLVLSAFVGLKLGNSDHMVPGAVNTNTAANRPDDQTASNTVSSDPTDPGNTANTADPSLGPTAPVADPTAMTPKDIAATMQDYSVDPTTGQAKEIKLVDDNYLILVNRTHGLAEDYVPEDMVKVKHVVSGVGKAGETDHLRKVAADAFDAMADAAAEAGINIKMRTGYRSYEYQRDRLYNLYVKNNGQEYADTISARPGHSEHQTGLALDVGGETEKYALSRAFGTTKEGKWVAEHCHEFGFIIRYTDGSEDSPGPTTGYIAEPWHIRYIGIDAASEVYYSGQLLEEYLGVLY